MMLATLSVLVMGCGVARGVIHARGEFGNQIVFIDVQFGDDVMDVTIHKPTNAPENFRETTNRHIFSRQLVAMKNSKDKHCYVRHFVESEDLMKGRFENAEYNNGRIGNLMEEVLHLVGLSPLDHSTTEVSLGTSIVTFCRGHTIYIMGRNDYEKIEPQDLDHHGQLRHSKDDIYTAGVCY